MLVIAALNSTVGMKVMDSMCDKIFKILGAALTRMDHSALMDLLVTRLLPEGKERVQKSSVTR